MGGANLHASRSGIASLIAEDELDACELAAEILSFLPDHQMANPPQTPCDDDVNRLNEDLESLVPDSPNRPYDMVKVIESIVDDGYFMELFNSYAENIVIGYGRLDGRPIGIIGNQPKVLAGCLDIDASIKAARFIRTCDAFNIPLVTFEDVPGFLPGVVQEWGGIIRHGAKLLYAYAEATVPKLTLITRKAYGGAYLAMSCKHLRSDYNVALPTAELAVMGADGAVNIIHRREIAAADDEEKEPTRQRLVEEYKNKFGDPYVAARNGWLDDVIEPRESRKRLIRALRFYHQNGNGVHQKSMGISHYDLALALSSKPIFCDSSASFVSLFSIISTSFFRIEKNTRIKSIITTAARYTNVVVSPSLVVCVEGCSNSQRKSHLSLLRSTKRLQPHPKREYSRSWYHFLERVNR